MKKSLLSVLSIICAYSAQASDDLQEFLIKENITTTSVATKITTESKPDTFKTIVEFSNTAVDSKKAQAELNKLIKKSTDLLKAQNFEYELGHFNTYQDYKSKKYIAKQTITLENKDKEKLEKITTTLQNQDGKVVSTVSFLSDEEKSKQFENLFTQAYNDAVKKAEFLTKQLGGQKYTIISINHYMNAADVRPVAFKTMALEARMDSAANIELDNSDKEIWLDLNMQIAIYK